ncbi:MAG: hypothetical protein D6806_10765, partial [Deltaproteobacteria bacterium]
ALAISLVASCSRSRTAEAKAPRVVATVNGQPIMLDRLQEKFDEISKLGRGYFPDKQTAAKIKRELLEQLIDETLLEQQAKKKGIELDPRLVEEVTNLPSNRYPAGEFEKLLLERGKDLQKYRKDTRRTLLIFKLLDREVVQRVAVSEKEIRDYYEQNPKVRQNPEMVRVRQIVTKTKEEAEQLRKRLLRGEDFATLARQYSLGPEAENGGDLGFFARGTMPPAIEQSCFALWRPGQISKVVTSPYGYHIFQLVERKPVQELTLEQARSKIEKFLMARKISEAEAYYMRKLRERADIVRNLDLLELVH